jgi:hypothetical protein
MSATVLQFRKPRTLADRACKQAFEAKTLQLRAELMPVAREYYRGLVAGMELEQRFAGVMLNIEERV